MKTNTYVITCSNCYDNIINFFRCNTKVEDGNGERKYILKMLRNECIATPYSRDLTRHWQKELRKRLGDTTFRIWQVEDTKYNRITNWIKKNP